MFRQHETNPHFLPRQNDPVIEFPLEQVPRQWSRMPPPPPRQTRTQSELPQGLIRPKPRKHQPPPQPIPSQPFHTGPPSSQLPYQESRPHPISEPSHPQPFTPLRLPQHTTQPSPTSHHHHHHNSSSLLRIPTSRKTKPIAWLVAAFCALFWTIIIVGGLIILIVYLVFRPRNPRFDLSMVTLNAAYLDMGYLLNADVTLLVNFTNPNTKVHVDFSYVILDLYYDKNVIATSYIQPFSVMRRESRFANVHMVASQVRFDMAHSLELQRQMQNGRVNFEIRGLFKTRSKLGGLFQYTYWLYAHCEITVTGPPAGILVRKRCVTKR